MASNTRPQLGQFSLVSILVFTVVFSSLSLTLGYFYRSFEDKQFALGQFIFINAMSPLITLSAVSLFFRIVNRNRSST